MKKKAVVAIVGRPNVGKSTLFNRLVRRRVAIVDNQPGVTRDRHYAEVEWAGSRFVLIDTGGYLTGSGSEIDQAVLWQIDEAIGEADLIVFLVDGKVGIVGLDSEIAAMLLRRGKPIVLGVNKIDHSTHDLAITDFYKLGLGDPVPLSAESGRQVGDFLDAVVAALPERLRQFDESTSDNGGRDAHEIRLAIVGRPNVGKSSLVNGLLRKEKLIVTDVPGTTRDSIDTELRYKNKKFVLIDTAGLRKRSRVQEAVEYYSTVRTRDAIQRCDIAALLIDSQDGITDQDLHILAEISRLRKGVLLAINKWDLIEKDANTVKIFESNIKERLRIYNYVPYIFISAKRQQRIFKLLDFVIEVHEQRARKLRTSEINKFLQEAVGKYPPPSMDRKEVKINYGTQVKSAPPVFAVFCNHPDSLRRSYRQYLEKAFRKRFGFAGVPLTFSFRKK